MPMFGIREKVNAIAEIPDQLKTMTLIVIGVGFLSIIALLMASMAVRNAN